MFSYDAFGNLTKAGSNSFNPGYNTITNRMSTGATYDSNGDVLTDSLHSYAWDVETRPTAIDTVTVTYDALGRMVEQTKAGASTEIVYDAVGNKLALMSTTTTLKTAFAPLPAGATAVYNASGLQYYRHSDWLGSARFSSTPTRTMYNDLAYAPFGEQYAPSGTTSVTNTSFAGNNQDTTTNLYDAQFREYGIQGRWPSPDPAGIAAANPANPQSWNRYAYALNSPLLFVDPMGLDPIESCASAQNGKKDQQGRICQCDRDGFCFWIPAIGQTVTVNGSTPPPDPIVNPVLNPTLTLNPTGNGPTSTGGAPGSPQSPTPQQPPPSLKNDVYEGAVIGAFVGGVTGCIVGALPGSVVGSVFGGPGLGTAAGGLAGCAALGLNGIISGGVTGAVGGAIDYWVHNH